MSANVSVCTRESRNIAMQLDLPFLNPDAPSPCALAAPHDATTLKASQRCSSEASRFKSSGGVSALSPEAHENERLTATEDTAAPVPETLADVLVALAAGRSKKHAEMRSALQMIGKVIGRPLRDIPASLPRLSDLVAQASPTLVGMTPARWARVRSLTLAALRKVGLEVMPGRYTSGHSANWRGLFTRLARRGDRHGLSRFASFCTLNTVEPDGVTEEVFAQFRLAAFQTSLHPDPMRLVRTTAICWNRAVRDHAEWPQILLDRPADERRYAHAKETFPEEFRIDVEGYLAKGRNPDPFADDYARPLRPATIRNQRRALFQIASALVKSGVPAHEVRGLASLTEPQNAQAALRWLRQRNGGKTAHHIAGKADLLRTVALHWVKDEGHAEVVRRYASALREQVKHKGIVPKNRERLRQFDLDENVRALLLLPLRIQRQVQATMEPTSEDALRLMMALAIELLLVAPMRMKNLTSLEVERHLVVVRRGRKSSLHIVIPSEETKTNGAFEMELPEASRRLLDAYLGRYRALHMRGSSPYLFVGAGREHRSSSAFGRAISVFILRETGLKMHPHLFRHLAAKLHLDAHPQQIETVRMVLGHSSTRTTLSSYAEFSSDAAFRAYDATIAARRSANDKGQR